MNDHETIHPIGQSQAESRTSSGKDYRPEF